jgi:hypothetical protein
MNIQLNEGQVEIRRNRTKFTKSDKKMYLISDLTIIHFRIISYKIYILVIKWIFSMKFYFIRESNPDVPHSSWMLCLHAMNSIQL